jgi:hypothetical protein
LNRSWPEGLNSDKYGSAPQPTNRSPFRVVCALPCDGADRPPGWLSDATRVAVFVLKFS